MQTDAKQMPTKCRNFGKHAKKLPRPHLIDVDRLLVACRHRIAQAGDAAAWNFFGGLAGDPLLPLCSVCGVCGVCSQNRRQTRSPRHGVSSCKTTAVAFLGVFLENSLLSRSTRYCPSSEMEHGVPMHFTSVPFLLSSGCRGSSGHIRISSSLTEM